MTDKYVKTGLSMPWGREEEKSEGKRKRVAQGPTLSHTAGQEVLDGDTLPSCQRTIHHSVSHHMTHVTSITVDSAMLCTLCILYGAVLKAMCCPVMYFSKNCCTDNKTLAPRDASQGVISSGNSGFFPSSAFDFSAYDNKEMIVMGGIYFLSIYPCVVFFG